MQIAAIIIVALVILVLIAAFVWSIALVRKGKLEIIADKDKAQLEGLAPKNILGQFIILFGALSIMAAFYGVISSMYSGSATPNWSNFFIMLISGVGLIYVGVLLA